jgi:hypothetical protein
MSRRPNRAASPALIVTILALLLTPSARAATVTVGQLFMPTGSNTCGGTDLQATVASGTPYVVSAPGVITSWSFQTDATTPAGLKLKVAHSAGGSSYTIVAETPAGAQVPNAVNTYPAGIPVQTGDLIGIYGGSGDCAEFTTNPADGALSADGDVAPGTTSAFVSAPEAKIDVSAQEVLAPGIGSVSPSAGPAAGGTSVTITGHDCSGATAVSFGAAPAQRFTVTSDDSITAVAPAAVAGTIDVTVTTAGGRSPTSIGDHFTSVPRPAVTSVSPTRGQRAGGAVVTITGHDFTGATAVNFGGHPARGFGIVSDTLITAVAPAARAGAVDITVTTTGGQSTTAPADRFTFVQVCVVPNLRHKTLAAAKKALGRAHCRAGTISGPKSGKVTRQSRKPGKVLLAGAKVNFTLGRP